MRRAFSQLLHEKMSVDPRVVVLTGDLGYGLWDKVRLDFPRRFYNVGSSEQLMLGAASGMAMEGKIPFVYSITPFLLYRPFEFIRNYLDHEQVPVKLIGGGRGKDYGKLGFTHWAEDDKRVMSCFDNIDVYHPEQEEELRAILDTLVENNRPSYLNLVR
jgi:transketolase